MAGLRTAREVADLVERTAGVTAPAGRDAYPRGMGRLQAFAGGVMGPFSRWWFSLDVRGTEYMPRSGPVVLCMNHESLLDIPIVTVASPRQIRMMAKQELFAKPAGARFFHELGGFPVQRGGFDLRAVEIGLEVLRRGEVLGMYPEGTRTPGVLLPFLPGAAWLALSTGASTAAVSPWSWEPRVRDSLLGRWPHRAGGPAFRWLPVSTHSTSAATTSPPRVPAFPGPHSPR